MYFCGICDDLDFTTKGRCLGHLREQHAGLQYKCLKCRKLFRRNDNPHICGARREDYIPFVMSTGEKGEAALRVLNQFMQNAEENLVIVRNVMLNENEYEAKFDISAGRGRGRGRGRPFNRINVVDYTARKRTQPALPYNGKCRRLSSSSVSSRSSSASSSSSSTSSSSNSSISSASSSSSTASVQTKTSAKFSEDEEKLMEIGMATASLYSYEEMTGCDEPFLGEIIDERRVIENSKIEIENKEKERRVQEKREKEQNEQRDRREREERERNEKEEKESRMREQREKEQKAEKDRKEKEEKERRERRE